MCQCFCYIRSAQAIQSSSHPKRDKVDLSKSTSAIPKLPQWAFFVTPSAGLRLRGKLCICRCFEGSFARASSTGSIWQRNRSGRAFQWSRSPWSVEPCSVGSWRKPHRGRRRGASCQGWAFPRQRNRRHRAGCSDPRHGRRRDQTTNSPFALHAETAAAPRPVVAILPKCRATRAHNRTVAWSRDSR